MRWVDDEKQVIHCHNLISVLKDYIIYEYIDF